MVQWYECTIPTRNTNAALYSMSVCQRITVLKSVVCYVLLCCIVNCKLQIVTLCTYSTWYHGTNAQYLHETRMSLCTVCQYVSMSVCQYVSMSVCQYVSMSVCQYVSMSVCRYVSMSMHYSIKVGGVYYFTYCTNIKVRINSSTVLP
jgi:hypothetical protein